jgi:hypothetical protein
MLNHFYLFQVIDFKFYGKFASMGHSARSGKKTILDGLNSSSCKYGVFWLSLFYLSILNDFNFLNFLSNI